MKTMKSPSIVLLALGLGCLPTAHAAQESPAASASVGSAAPIGSASAPPVGMEISAYNWPRDASDKPKDEEWAGATEIQALESRIGFFWDRMKVTCRLLAVREWARIDCSPPSPPRHFRDFPHYFGAAWGVAGDVSTVSAQFRLVSQVEKYASKLKPTDDIDRLQLGMGAHGILTFQVKYGSATMLRLDQILWAEQYDGGGSVLVHPGILIDVAWALGEKYPTISIQG